MNATENATDRPSPAKPPRALRKGIYQHYKGNRYRVYEVATHSETGEQLVVYRCLYGDYSLWVRPLGMFLETVDVEGCTVRRFEFQSDEDDAVEADSLGDR